MQICCCLLHVVLVHLKYYLIIITIIYHYTRITILWLLYWSTCFSWQPQPVVH